MKVVQVNTKSTDGGAARCAEELHMALSLEQGLEPILLSGRDRATTSRAGIVGLGVPRWKLYANVLAYRMLGADGPLNQGHWRSVAPLITSADVVHLNNAHGYYLPLNVLEQLLHRPTVWTLHDYWLATGRRGFPRNPVRPLSIIEKVWPWGGHDYPAELVDHSQRRRRIIDDMLRRHRPALIAITQDMALRLAKMGIPRDLVQVIPHGIFHNTGSPNLVEQRRAARTALGWPSKETLLFVAAKLSNPFKGWQVLRHALGQLQHPERWHLVVVGGGKAMPMPVQTTFMGMLDHNQTILCFRATDVYINPTLDETFGRTTIEALGEGAHVICSDLPVTREVAPEARFFPVGASAKLAEMIDAYEIGSMEKREADATRVRDRFLFSTMVKRYRAAYETAVAQL